MCVCMKSFVPLIFSEMELGLSLGDTRKSVDGIMKENNNQQKPTKKKSELGFCMALGLNSSAVENDDQRSEGHGSDDDINEGENENHLQLNLLPLASNNESLENGSSGNMGLAAAAIGLDVNSLPAASAAEEVSSANSDGSRFQMGFATYRRNSDDDEDDDNNGLNTRKKLRLSKEQSAFLEESFKEHHTLYPKQKLELAKQLNLRPRQVEVWFQNRRARTKLKQTEVDCEYLKRCRETLTEENKRLQKELQELRALKTSNPFYMQLPATTLTMCPSCERVAAAPPPSSAATATATAAAPKTIAFPLSRPILYPYSKTSNQSTAS